MYADVTIKKCLTEQYRDITLEKDFHVQRQAYHSNTLTENHCHSIIKNYENLLQVLRDDREGGKLQVVLESSHLYYFTTCKFRKSNSSTVKYLGNATDQFHRWCSVHFPTETVLKKVCILCMHIPHFCNNMVNDRIIQ